MFKTFPLKKFCGQTLVNVGHKQPSSNRGCEAEVAGQSAWQTQFSDHQSQHHS